jgi:hypothetical protein
MNNTIYKLVSNSEYGFGAIEIYIWKNIFKAQLFKAVY